jgi:hypothetical protein
MPEPTPVVDELRTAAARLRSRANAALMEVLTNDYWASEIVPAENTDGRYAHGMTGGMGGAGGDLAAVFTPGLVTLLAELLDGAADHWPIKSGAGSRLLAVARKINAKENDHA